MEKLDLHCLLAEHHSEGGHQIQAPPGYRLQDGLLLLQNLFALGPKEVAAMTFSLQEKFVIAKVLW